MPAREDKRNPVKPEPVPTKVHEPFKWVHFAPPQPSLRLGWWLEYVANGFRPNKKIRDMVFEDLVVWSGCYAWEVREHLVPAFRSMRQEDVNALVIPMSGGATPSTPESRRAAAEMIARVDERIQRRARRS